MSTLSILVAQGAVFVMALVAAVVWLRVDRHEKAEMVVAGALTAAALGLLLLVAGSLWTDPRPFVVDGITPLIAHPADNGFPSDHSALAAAIAVAVWFWHRRVGVVLAVLAVAVAASRVAVRVHHVPDVTAGLAIGALAAVIGVLAGRALVARWDARRSSVATTRELATDS